VSTPTGGIDLINEVRVAVSTQDPNEIITVLLPEDEYTHEPGAWFRIGNRVNEGYAEMSVCFYLPDNPGDMSNPREAFANNPMVFGEVLHTPITEAMTRFTCEGRDGIGMSEFLDQVVDGWPVGVPAAGK
jgi:hypothetical protein